MSSWQQQQQQGMPRRRVMSEEEGEIGEEEGEIGEVPAAAAATQQNPPNTSATATSAPAQPKQPPPAAVNPVTQPASQSQQVPPPRGPATAAVGAPAASAPNVSTQQQQNTNASPAGPPHPQPPRRGGWGGGRGPPGPGRGAFRGRGHRHGGFGTLPGPPGGGNLPPRSQSFAGFPQGLPGGPGDRGAAPPSSPAQQPAAKVRPTDPRFRAAPLPPLAGPSGESGPPRPGLPFRSSSLGEASSGGPPPLGLKGSASGELSMGERDGPGFAGRGFGGRGGDGPGFAGRGPNREEGPGFGGRGPFGGGRGEPMFRDGPGGRGPHHGPSDGPGFVGGRGPDAPGFGGRDSFRGGRGPGPGPGNRRGGDFRGAGGDSYYGSGAGPGPGEHFRRHSSPPQRARPIFGGGGRGPGGPGGPMVRQNSFGKQQQPHRRNDPRFAQSEGPDAVRSMDHGMEAEGGFPMQREGSFYRKQQQQTQDSSTDAFGRQPQQDWASQQKPHTPQGSPVSRKPVLSYFQSSPSERELPPPPALGGDSSTSPNSAARASRDVAAVVEESAPKLLTSVLGEANVERAEKVVGLVSELMKDDSLKSKVDGQLSELPSKQLILRAVAQMHDTIKIAQNDVETMELEVEQARRDEEEMLQQKMNEELAEERRQEEERLVQEEERQREEEKERQQELKSMLDERRGELESEKENSVAEFEEKLKVAKEEEEKRQSEDTEKQIIAATERFDRDIAKVTRDLEQAKEKAAKSEIEVVTMEANYRAMVESGTKEESSTSSAPSTQDVVSRILAENKRRAAEAHVLSQFATISEDESGDNGNSNSIQKQLENVRDPKHNKTSAEWWNEARQVTGLADALYTEPKEAPYFEQNEKTHAVIAPLVKEYIRDKKNRVQAHHVSLAEEFEFRKIAYETQLGKRTSHAKGTKNHAVMRQSIIGKQLESTGASAATAAAASTTTSTNPYRRARRGNEVRSEYEQEQIIAELAAKEAMQKKIEFGGSALPRQIGTVERQVTATFKQTFTSQKVDVVAQEADLAITSVWSDMEKCVFLDRFLQHPKDFRKIASFLRNKTTKDCVRFYYDSKQYIPYKEALREHIMRRKRRGDYHVWDATIQAALSVGAVVEAGPSEDKPLVFLLPESDMTFSTRQIHPMKRELFNALTVDPSAVSADDIREYAAQSADYRKRKHEPLFLLDAEKRKFLRSDSSESLDALQNRSGAADRDNAASAESQVESGQTTPFRKAPQKWTAAERRVFVETLEQHGRNWSMLAQAVGTKTISQIKNYYYDYKKQNKGVKEGKKSSKSESKSQRQDDRATPTPSVASSSVPETPVEETVQQQLQRQLEEQQTAQQQQYQQQVQLIEQQLRARQAEEQRRAHSGTNTPDNIAELLLAQHQAQQALSTQQAQNLLQQHSQAQLLMPWLSQDQVARNDLSSQLNDLQNLQNLQNLIQLRQQAQQLQQQNHSQQNPLAALGNASQLRSLALANLEGSIDPTALALALQRQQAQQQQQLGDLEAQQQLALQQLLGRDTSAADALQLLARILPRGDGRSSGASSLHGSERSQGDNK